MKKYYYLPILLFLLLANACTGIESKIEEKIKTSMDDPSSFELISIEPLDTLILADNELFLSVIKRYRTVSSKESEQTMKMNSINEEIDFHKMEVNNCKTSTINDSNDEAGKSALNWIIIYRQKLIDSLKLEHDKVLKNRIVFSKELLDLRDNASNILNEYSGVKNFDLINYNVEFRGTNNFGALVKSNTKVVIYNNEAYTSFNELEKAFKDDVKKLPE